MDFFLIFLFIINVYGMKIIKEQKYYINIFFSLESNQRMMLYNVTFIRDNLNQWGKNFSGCGLFYTN